MYKLLTLIITVLSLSQLVFGQTDTKLREIEITNLRFGKITVNGVNYDEDIVIDNGEVRQRKKGPSKPQKEKYNHTPLTPLEIIPWDCDTIVIGTGMYGSLPVVDEFKKEAKNRGVVIILLKTPQAVKYYKENYSSGLNAILHITC